MNEKELDDFILDNFAEQAKGPEQQVEPPKEDPIVEPVEENTPEVDEASEGDSEQKQSSDKTDEDSDAEGSTEDEEQAKPEDSSEDELEWDSFIDDEDDDTPETQAKPTFDFTGISAELGKEIKSSDELVSAIKELKSSYQTSLDEQTSGLPEELAQAIEVARQGGDYLSVLDIGSIDYENEDPIDVFEDEAAEMFYNQDGSFNEDEYYDYIDGLSDTEKRMRGSQIKRELINVQKQKVSQLQQQAYLKKQGEIRAIQEELDKVTKIAGFDIKPKIKKNMFEALSSGKYMEDLFKGRDGKFDWKKSIDTYFKAKYFDAIQKANEHKIKTNVKREIQHDINNTTVDRSPKPENPVQTAKKPTGAELYIQEFLLNTLNSNK